MSKVKLKDDKKRTYDILVALHNAINTGDKFGKEISQVYLNEASKMLGQMKKNIEEE